MRTPTPYAEDHRDDSSTSLFGVRMKRAGVRWHQDTAEDIVTLRTFALSDRWDAAVDLTLRLGRREVKLAA